MRWAPCPCILLLSRLAGADEEESVRIILCIGYIMMKQNSIRWMTSFRHTIDLNVARRSIGNTMIAQIVQLLHYLRKDTLHLLLSKLWFLFQRQSLGAYFGSPVLFLQRWSLSSVDYKWQILQWWSKRNIRRENSNYFIFYGSWR